MEKTNTGKKAFLLLAGGGMGAWIWEELIPLLAYPAIAVDRRLPGSNGAGATIADCAKHAARHLADAGITEAVVVAHSGAGIYAPLVARFHTGIRHMAFVSANIPAQGKTALAALPLPVRILNAWALRREQKPRPLAGMEKMLGKYYFNASGKDALRKALPHTLQSEPSCLAFEAVNRSGLPAIPATFVSLLHDRTISVKGQRAMAGNMGITDIVEIEADHMVMMGKPKELARVLNGIANRAFAGEWARHTTSTPCSAG